MSDEDSELRRPTIRKPYCSVGAGRLTSFVWKSGDEDDGWRYRFNLFRSADGGGRTSQRFAPSDLLHFVKLVQVLAAVIADDGCSPPAERGALRRLAADLDRWFAQQSGRSTDRSEEPAPPVPRDNES